MIEAIGVLGILGQAFAVGVVRFRIIRVAGFRVGALGQLSHHLCRAPERIVHAGQIGIALREQLGGLIGLRRQLAAVGTVLLGKREAELASRADADELNRRRGFVEGKEVIEQTLAVLENVLNDLNRDAADVPYFYREIGDQIVRRVRCGVQRLFGAIALLLGDLLLRDRNPLFADRDEILPERGGAEHRQQKHGGPRQRQGTPLLPDLFRKQILFGHAANGGGEVGAQFGEFTVALRRALPIGAQIDPFGFGGKFSLETGRKRCCIGPGNVAAARRPRQLAVGHRNQQRVDALVLKPVADFLADPLRARGFAGGEQHQIAGLRQRDLDRRPQVWRCRQAGVIAKDAECAALVPGLAQRLNHRLQHRGNRFVLGVTIRDEGVVERHCAVSVAPPREA